MLYGIQAGFGSPQVPVAELLARPAPTLLSPQKPKSSNFLQVPDMESPRYVPTIKIVIIIPTRDAYLVNPIQNCVSQSLLVKAMEKTKTGKLCNLSKKKKEKRSIKENTKRESAKVAKLRGRSRRTLSNRIRSDVDRRLGRNVD